ncbi:N-acetylglucosamine-1-phosphodiester alpha-N-acetylglucosaminidase isoform X1 [Falco rusticolus]|uniref:N-acetylglucosamine-1-phosphodiester alpha-N-acetylglucosaminidase isoform X1 n=2 Tax=Falco rusticolus TaxID=120794 RepID=UPI001886A0B5|nr:N-acetylglucosamine-1-phosphodiester alpha-N-acetylglucosaminidase isoform X1 [Falco rusticolus]XP_037239255.1 N-acetylglucosamine-1-phosphodiester alpha-N-acetylglucosaminidase isoform X1 [Falco rusticolus]XP_037239256.1 N-acetylglucosamine-1-phosphodiester alpha-N-acetylglucosaminidase isoform X1 [Falco rusticolus]
MAASRAAGAAGWGRPEPAVVVAAVLAALGWLQATCGAGTPPSDLLLQPYFPSPHGPRHNHRHVRDCQPLKYGNITHEAWPSDNRTGGPVATTRTFVSYIPSEGKDRKVVYGHFTFVKNPLKTFSVLEPGGTGGCQAHRRAPVEETARLGKCLVAQNGGYFDMGTGECFGNVVSDGKLVRNSGGLQNAQFGIRKDGTMVFGYLSEEDVLDQANAFVQLVSGVVWLLRNGEVYVSQSQMAECGETQTTGTFEKFINVISARTAVGHDSQGHLVLVHVDGQTESRGVNLWEMAEFLKQQGIINAINLDGGGSATLVLNGTLASYPSEHCSFDNMWRCPRSISTIMCIHEPACEPADCSGHGDCVEGECHCTGDFWRGPACDILDCGPSNCSLHGTCTDSGCLCDAGWTGSNCSEACASGFYGDACTQKCQCYNGGSCDPLHGACSCLAGYYGTSCERECPMGWYGPNCQQQCACEHMCPCDRETGSCNITYAVAVQDQLNKAGQCLAFQNKGRSQEKFSLSEKTWISMTSVLTLLLVISTVGNIGLFLKSRPERQGESSDYLYHRLREVNGEASHSPTAAAWETEDSQDQSQALL